MEKNFFFFEFYFYHIIKFSILPIFKKNFKIAAGVSQKVHIFDVYLDND